MKALIGLAALFYVLAIGPARAQSDSVFYYHQGQRTWLKIDTTKLLIKFQNFSPSDGFNIIKDSFPEIGFVDDFGGRLSNYGLFEKAPQTGYNDLSGQIYEHSIVTGVGQVTLTRDSLPCYITDEIVCQLSPTIDAAWFDSILNAEQLYIKDSSKFIAKNYVVAPLGKCPPNLVDICNYIHDLEGVEYAHPNFGGEVTLNSYQIYDIYLDEYPNIRIVTDYNDHLGACWEITTGTPEIIISILDDGIEWHQDFDTSRFTPGYDFYNDDSIPTPDGYEEYHGMAVAGLICALHNNPLPDYPPGLYRQGFYSIAGMAPSCSFQAVKMSAGGPIMDAHRLAQAIRFATQSGAAVMNCSWGFPIQNDDMQTAIEDAYEYGRWGLGTVIVFAAGNVQNFDHTIHWPANLPYVLAVGATDTTDQLYGYSCYGDSLDLVATSGHSTKPPAAPPGVWSTDRMDSLGENPNVYTCDPNNIHYICGFGGTSAAAPLVAGTAALVLSRQPDLTVQEVFQVLRYSADTSLRWGEVSRPHPLYGYGRLNTYKALLSIIRGDVDNSGGLSILDVTYIINFLYKGGPAPQPHTIVGDANCNGVVNIIDVTYINSHLYYGGPEPPICFDYTGY